MCIRDRLTTPVAAPGKTDRIAALAAAGDVTVVVDHAVQVAVSYTHLRAHETVLDLVCRLLLEKKNTKESTHEHSTQYWLRT